MYFFELPSYAQLIYGSLTKKIIFILELIIVIEILEFQKYSTVRSVKNILGNKSKPRILPDMKFGIRS